MVDETAVDDDPLRGDHVDTVSVRAFDFAVLEGEEIAAAGNTDRVAVAVLTVENQTLEDVVGVVDVQDPASIGDGHGTGPRLGPDGDRLDGAAVALGLQTLAVGPGGHRHPVAGLGGADPVLDGAEGAAGAAVAASPRRHEPFGRPGRR